MHMTHKRVHGLLSAFLILSSAACAHSGPVKLVPIPAEMTQPVPEPALQGETNGDLVTWIDAWREALREANRRLESIGNVKP